jgi:hypothetical protein
MKSFRREMERNPEYITKSPVIIMEHSLTGLYLIAPFKGSNLPVFLYLLSLKVGLKRCN